MANNKRNSSIGFPNMHHRFSSRFIWLDRDGVNDTVHLEQLIADLPIGTKVYDVNYVPKPSNPGYEEPGANVTYWTIVSKEESVNGSKVVTLLTTETLGDIAYESFKPKLKNIPNHRYDRVGTLPATRSAGKELQFNYIHFCSPLLRSKILETNLDISQEQDGSLTQKHKVYLPSLSELCQDRGGPQWNEFSDYWYRKTTDRVETTIREATEEAHEAALDYPNELYQKYYMPYFYTNDEQYPEDQLYMDYFPIIDSTDEIWVRDWNYHNDLETQLVYTMQGYEGVTNKQSNYIEYMAVINIPANTKVYKTSRGYTFIPTTNKRGLIDE